jgi:NADH-quinone oxidoreductase subunit L
MDLATLTWLIPLPPLLAFGLIVLFLNRNNTVTHVVALGAIITSWLLSWFIVFNAVFGMGAEQLREHPIAASFAWLPTGAGALRMGVAVDHLTVLMLFFVPLACVLIFLYSVGYSNFSKKRDLHDEPGLPPHHGREPMYSRFFAYLCLFAAGMLTLTVADNLLLLFVGWEVMGLCSYSLIGFWYARDYDNPKATPPRKAAIKAFMTTRVADVFMMLGIVYLYTQAGTLTFHDVFFNPAVMEQLVSTPAVIAGFTASQLIGLLLFIGTVGKSAQFPLHVWLPDAMEGPTPVSAMIHAAAMVSAGIYMLARMFPVVSLAAASGVAEAAGHAAEAAGHAVAATNPTMLIITTIGTFTALFGSTIAVAQKDVKKVLAYSTISQLGFMVAALGIGAYVPAVFHLMTHAFFKALLFMGSGSIIHGVEHGMHDVHEHIDPQDMFNMGGLRKKMPVTFITFLIGGLALSGFPLITAGFWSKDEILGEAWAHGHYIVFAVLCTAAFLTAFYTMRQIALTFFGEPRTKSAANAHENTWTMVLPLVILAFFSVTAGFIGVHHEFPVLGELFGGNPLEHWLAAGLPTEVEAFAFSWIPVGASIFVALGGLTLGWWVYGRKPLTAGQADPLRTALGTLYGALENKWYLDEVYQVLFIRPAHWIGETFAFRWLDRGVIDGLIHLVAFGALRTGRGASVWELAVVDEPPNKLANSFRLLGKQLRFMQSGHIQNYVMYTLIAVILVGGAFAWLWR